jgi:hypothetical protein
MQRAFGVTGVDVLNWRPKYEGTGQICRQSILRMVRLACAGAQRQDHGRSNSERPKADTILVADLTDVEREVAGFVETVFRPR